MLQFRHISCLLSVHSSTCGDLWAMLRLQVSAQIRGQESIGVTFQRPPAAMHKMIAAEENSSRANLPYGVLETDECGAGASARSERLMCEHEPFVSTKC